MKKIEFIFFDLDDTLIDSEKIYDSCYKILKLERNPKFVEAKSMVKASLPTGHTSSHNRMLYFKKFIELKTGKTASTDILKLNSNYEKTLSHLIAQDLKKTKILAVLKKLSKKCKLAIITNETCRTQMIKMAQIDPKGILFNFILTSEEVGVEKPDQKIFHEALKRAKVAPSNAIMVGDSLENDIEPSQALGLISIHTTQFKKNEPDRTNSSKVTKIQNLADLLFRV